MDRGLLEPASHYEASWKTTSPASPCARLNASNFNAPSGQSMRISLTAGSTLGNGRQSGVSHRCSLRPAD